MLQGAQAIQRPSLHEELVERLRNLVIEDELKPGEKIPEKELCAAFSVSRTPLREALKVLASEGLIVLQANRGARVSEVTMEELAQTFPVIATLEQLAGELACKKMTDADLASIEQRHNDMIDSYAAKDRQSYFKANQDIHNAIIKAARNDVLESHHRLLASRVRRARFMANISEERWAQAIAEHEDMLKHLKARDAQALGQLMRNHLMNKFSAHMRSAETGAS
ncbi:GntR family transcriptional regulator [Thalassococcus sp. S3]|uniref:GntR family transcriptional regulator n=1 Tax=Thalassococcus sp. S3 TaxID=2017482 RepID=UPI0010246944|nr:GntR family transcriptional regulator [Thalassococcus sp. S3]QBF33641.1 GntR family transcriptional regulator [Thalassococcus sp. S3]